MALALELFLEIDAAPAAEFSIHATGRNPNICGGLTRNLLIETYKSVLAAEKRQIVPLGLHMRNGIPVGMGCGSSAAVRLAAVALASAFGELAWDAARIVDYAVRLEGHPDNAAACLAGGLTIAWNPGTGPRVVRLDPLPAIVPVLCVPAESMPTTAARRVLPRTVPHADAAANAGRSALLVAALTRSPDLLFDATQDLLHEPYRAPLMPATADLMSRLRGAGIAAVLSGAGPSVLALTVRGETPGPAKVDSIAGQAGKQWHVSPLDVDRQGATIASVPPGGRPPNRRNARTART